MILVDSSVWIDHLGGRDTLETRMLERYVVEDEALGIGDLMMIEVLQGTRDERRFRLALERLSDFDPVVISDHRVAMAGARFYRHLRGRGITIRKTIDTLIATRCILDGFPLLYRDRDYQPFVEHLGLVSALALDPTSEVN